MLAARRGLLLVLMIVGSVTVAHIVARWHAPLHRTAQAHSCWQGAIARAEADEGEPASGRVRPDGPAGPAAAAPERCGAY